MDDKTKGTGVFKDDGVNSSDFKDAGHGEHILRCPSCKRAIGSLKLEDSKVSLYFESERES